VDFEISPEQEQLRDSVRAVLESECPTSLVRRLAEGGEPPQEPWRSALALGWPGIHVPAELGGLGLGFQELGLVCEVHGRFLAPGPFLATVTQFLPAVREAGSAEQTRRLAGAVLRGELRGALAAGSGAGDGLDLDLHARRDGATWRLDGARRFVLDGDTADEVVVAARVDEGDGCGLFLVPGASAKAERVESLDPSRPLAHLAFDGLRLEAGRVLGTPGRSARALGRALDEATVALALETVGACQALFERTLAYARQRVQFDHPIGSFQAVQHKCADMFVQLAKARATGYFALAALDEDDPRRSLAASMAKAAAGDCQRLVCKEAIQIHGGVGFTWESDVHLFVKRAKTADLLLGTAAEHRERIAAHLEL